MTKGWGKEGECKWGKEGRREECEEKKVQNLRGKEGRKRECKREKKGEE